MCRCKIARATGLLLLSSFRNRLKRKTKMNSSIHIYMFSASRCTRTKLSFKILITHIIFTYYSHWHLAQWWITGKTWECWIRPILLSTLPLPASSILPTHLSYPTFPLLIQLTPHLLCPPTAPINYTSETFSPLLSSPFTSSQPLPCWDKNGLFAFELTLIVIIFATLKSWHWFKVEISKLTFLYIRCNINLSAVSVGIWRLRLP